MCSLRPLFFSEKMCYIFTKLFINYIMKEGRRKGERCYSIMKCELSSAIIERGGRGKGNLRNLRLPPTILKKVWYWSQNCGYLHILVVNDLNGEFPSWIQKHIRLVERWCYCFLLLFFFLILLWVRIYLKQSFYFLKIGVRSMQGRM